MAGNNEQQATQNLNASQQRIEASARPGGFIKAPAQSNVGPAGAAQTSHGFAGDPVIAGGMEGRAEGSQNRQSDSDAAGKRQGGDAIDATDNSGIIDRVADRDNPVGPADGR